MKNNLLYTAKSGTKRKKQKYVRTTFNFLVSSIFKYRKVKLPVSHRIVTFQV